MKRPLLAATLLAAGTALAGPSAPAPSGKSVAETPKPSDPCEDLWGLATLYKNDANPFIQEFALTGRYQAQFAMVDGDHGDEEGWDNRRTRLGFRAKVWKDFEVKNEYYFDLNNEDWYGDAGSGITDLYIAYKPSDAFNLTVGKQKPKYSLDWTTSSREILTIERNILINNLGIDYATGLSVSGKQGNWSYFAGVFNNDNGDPGDARELGDLDGDWSWTASVGYDLKDSLNLDKAVLRADYIHMDHDAGSDDLLSRFDDSFALSFNAKKGQTGVITEVLWAEGDHANSRGGDGEMWGFYIMPTYDISKKVQVVGRFTHAEGDDYTLRAQGRYERGQEIGGISIPGSGYGDNYNAYYLGLNYYICGHKLKLMSGLEYSEFDGSAVNGDNDSLTWVNGLRFFF